MNTYALQKIYINNCIDRYVPSLDRHRVITESKSTDIRKVIEIGNDIVNASDNDLSIPKNYGSILNKGYRAVPAKEKKAILNYFSDVYVKNLVERIGGELIRVIAPRTDKYSNSFFTYIIRRGSIEIPFIITAGKSMGFVFEEQLNKNFKNQIRDGELIAGGVLEGLLINLNEFDDLPFDKKASDSGSAEDILENFYEIDDVIYQPGKSEARKFSNEIIDIGKDVSDVTLRLNNGANIYLSLKCGPSLLCNYGISGLIVSDNNIIQKQPHKFDDFFALCGIDFDLLVGGLTEYDTNTEIISKEDRKYSVVPKEDVGNEIINWLGSAIGCGYFYFKYKNSTKFQLIDFREPDTVREFLGSKIKNIEYVYPGISGGTDYGDTKTMVVVLYMDNNLKYTVKLRNSTGGLLPNKLTVETNFEKAESDKSIIFSIKRPFEL